MSPDPENVAELLIEAKDLSELMVDLAYASVFFDDEELAGEVERLYGTLVGYLRRMTTACIVASRSPEDARLMAGVIAISTAIGSIGHAASDIARIVLAKLGIPGPLVADLAHAQEIVGRVRVRQEGSAAGRSLGELHLPKETGMWIMAIRRGADWRFDPKAGTVLAEGDVLLFRGPQQGVNPLRQHAGAPPRPSAPAPAGPPLSDLDRAIDLLIQMKDTAETAVGLAYAAIAFEDTSLAAEVASLESESNRVHDQIEAWVLRAATIPRDDVDLRGVLRLASASESIFDAARKLASIVLGGEELHPIVQLALEEAEEIVSEAVVEPDSVTVGRPLQEVAADAGVTFLALRRRSRWMYRPSVGLLLEPGDRVMAIGSEEAVGHLAVLTSAASSARRPAGK